MSILGTVSSPIPVFFRAISESFGQRTPLSVESILSAAEQNRLHTYLAQHYTIWHDSGWQANLQLCRDMVEAGYLKAEFQEHIDSTPIFISKEARITIAGRDYLTNLRKSRPMRRFLVWTAIYFSGILSACIVRMLTQ